MEETEEPNKDDIEKHVEPLEVAVTQLTVSEGLKASEMYIPSKSVRSRQSMSTPDWQQPEFWSEGEEEQKIRGSKDSGEGWYGPFSDFIGN